MKRHPVEWTTRRKLFLVCVIVYEVLLAVGVVMVLFTSGGRAHALAWAIYVLVVTLVFGTLRQTYFKQIVAENRNRRGSRADPA